MSSVISGTRASAQCSGAGWSRGTKVSGGYVVDLMGTLFEVFFGLSGAGMFGGTSARGFRARLAEIVVFGT